MEVLKYIEYLNNLFEETTSLNPHKYYNWGGCYQFALLLKKKFPEGKIAVTHELMHVVFYYKGDYFDVDGIFHNTDDIIETEEALPPTVLRIISSYGYDEKTERPKRDYLKVYDGFSFDEQEEIYNFCMAHNCIALLNELEWREEQI